MSPPPKEVVGRIVRQGFLGPYGERLAVRLRPGLETLEILEFAGRLPALPSREMRELLAFAAGFEVWPWCDVSFTAPCPEQWRAVFPGGIKLAADRRGFWIADVSSSRDEWGYSEWGPVFFVCRAPAVVVIQAVDLSEFLGQVVPTSGAQAGALPRAAEEAALRVSLARLAREPGGLEALAAGVASIMSKRSCVVDLRAARSGTGFSYVSRRGVPRVARRGPELLFEVEQPLLLRLRHVWRSLRRAFSPLARVGQHSGVSATGGRA